MDIADKHYLDRLAAFAAGTPAAAMVILAFWLFAE